jgi:hypothetical protein
MTETPESPRESTITAADRSAETTSSKRPSRLGQAAAWVGIVAGVVFIVGAVFFSGFFLASRLEHRAQVMHCEMGGSGEGKGGMGGMGGMGPGGMGPMGPSQSPSSTSAAPPSPSPSTPRP